VDNALLDPTKLVDAAFVVVNPTGEAYAGALATVVDCSESGPESTSSQEVRRSFAP
jgi:hypothetical protein